MEKLRCKQQADTGEKMQAIVSLTRGLSRTLVNGVVSRNQSTVESSRTKHEEEADSRLGKFLTTLGLINNTDMSSLAVVFVQKVKY